MSTKKVMVGDVECGADKLFLISGPCVIESEKIMMDTAETLKRVSEDLDIPLIYKSSFQKDNRSSVDYYMGPGMDEGLKILQRVKEDFGFPLLTDIHYPDQVAPAAEVVDVLQIPAYLVMQTTLTVAAAKSGKVINFDSTLNDNMNLFGVNKTNFVEYISYPNHIWLYTRIDTIYKSI